MSILQAFKSNFLTLLVVLGVSAFSLTAVQATPIEGEVLFGGTVTVDSANIKDATTLDFGNVVVTDAFGDPAVDSVSSGDVATFNNMSLDPFVPLTPLWSVLATDSGGAFDWFFDLNSILSIDRSTSSQLNVFGTGVLRNSNGGEQDSSFSLSADSSGGRIAFSSTTTTTTTSVPEPATLGLLGLGLLALGGATRRRRGGTAASL